MVCEKSMLQDKNKMNKKRFLNMLIFKMANFGERDDKCLQSFVFLDVKTFLFCQFKQRIVMAQIGHFIISPRSTF
jgi:hypothetical protein